MNFKDARKQKGLSQQFLAQSLGIKQSAVAMWETGKSVPSMKNLLALQKLLEIPISTLVTLFPKNKHAERE